MRKVMGVLVVVLLPALLTGCATFFEHQIDSHRFSQAIALQRKGDRDKALKIYRSLTPHERRYPGVLNNIGVIYAQQGRLDIAEQRLAEAVRLEGDEAVIWTNLGIVRFLMEQHTTARQALEEVSTAGKRRLTKVAGKGRANFDYSLVRGRVNRSVAKAEAYLKLVARKVAAQRGAVERPKWLPGVLSLLRVQPTM